MIRLRGTFSEEMFSGRYFLMEPWVRKGMCDIGLRLNRSMGRASVFIPHLWGQGLPFTLAFASDGYRLCSPEVVWREASGYAIWNFEGRVWVGGDGLLHFTLMYGYFERNESAREIRCLQVRSEPVPFPQELAYQAFIGCDPKFLGT